MRAKIIIPSAYKYTSVARKFVYAFANNIGFTYSTLRDIILVLDELLNNAIEHGYNLEPNYYIEIECKVEKPYFTFSVTDFGVGFDLRKYRIPTAQDFDYYVTERGRGLFLVSSLADKVVYDVNFENGTRVLIKKRLPSNVEQSIEYFKENRSFFEDIAKKASDISGLQVSLVLFDEAHLTRNLPRKTVCSMISSISKQRDMCEEFHYKISRKPGDKVIMQCPFEFMSAAIPLTYKMESIGSFVIEPVLPSAKTKRKLMDLIKKYNPSDSFIQEFKTELKKTPVISPAKLQALVDIISLLANQYPIIRLQKDELQVLNSQMQKQNQKLKFLYEITRTLAMTFRPKDEIYNYIYGVVRNIIGPSKIIFWEYNVSNNLLVQHGNHKKKLRLAEGITGWVAYTGKATLVSNLSLDSRYRHEIEGFKDATSLLSIPIVSKSKVIGVVNIYRTAKQPNFDIAELQTLSMFLIFVGYMMENYELYYKLNLQVEQLNKLNILTNTLVTIYSLDDLLKTAANKVAELMSAEKSSIMLLKNNQLLIKAAHGLDADVINKVKVKIGQGVAGWVVEKGESLLVTDIENDPRFKAKRNRKYKSRSFLSVPIKIQDRVIGVVNVTNRQDGSPFTRQDLNMLEILATAIALAIQNIENIEKLKSGR